MGSQLVVPQKPQPTLRCLAEQFCVGDIPGEAPLGRQRALGSLPWLGSEAGREVAFFPSFCPDSACQGCSLLPSCTKHIMHIIFTESIQIKTSHCPSRYTYIIEKLEVETEETVKPWLLESYIRFIFDRLCCPSCRVSLAWIFVRTAQSLPMMR